MKTAKFSPKIQLQILSIFTIAFFLITNVQAQNANEEETKGLSSQFNELKAESESYNDYKVIKTYRLNTFWKEVEDSLGAYRGDIDASRAEIASLNNKIDDINAQLNEVKAQLDSSEAHNDSISFLGIELQKTLYNVIVWAIIGGLLFLTGTMFIAYKNNLILTKKSKKDYHDLIEEFETYRKESRDKQMKLGRELQTERNRLEEYKERLGKKEKAH